MTSPTTMPQGSFIPSFFEMAVAHAQTPPAQPKNTVDIIVGSGAGAQVVVVVSPARITSPGSALVTGNVFDANGNPVANVPVIFALEGVTGGTLYETLDSGGAPQFTDTNGQAFDRVRTRAPIGVTHSVIITATIPTAKTPGSVTLVVN